MEATQRSVERTPRGQGELLRERLIDAALSMLDDGAEPSGVSIRGVTKRAGVSPTAFYLHFESREELLRACVERAFGEFRTRVTHATGADSGEPLIDVGVAYIRFAREQPERYRLMFGSDWDEVGVTDDSEEGLEVADAAFADLAESISAYVGSSDDRSADLETLALGIWSGLHGFVTLCCPTLPETVLPTDEEFAAMLAAAWLGPPAGS